MNHATTLRHSRTHRDAAKRNAKALDARFTTRVTLRMRRRDSDKMPSDSLEHGLTVIARRENYIDDTTSVMVEIAPGSAFAFDPKSKHFRIEKIEKVRK